MTVSKRKRVTKKHPRTTAPAICVICKEEKPAIDFPTNARNISGIDGNCKSCSAAKTRAWRNTNPEAARASERLYKSKNKESVSVAHNLWKANNKEKVLAYSRKASATWKSKNEEHVINYSRKHYREFPEKAFARAALRRARMLNAVPEWLTKKQRSAIYHLYLKARALKKKTGVQYHVDHIVPLAGKIVSGLHVPWNMQVITAHENLTKSNKLDASLC